MENFVGGATRPAPVPPRAEFDSFKSNSKAGNSMSKIISNKNDKSQGKNPNKSII